MIRDRLPRCRHWAVLAATLALLISAPACGPKRPPLPDVEATQVDYAVVLRIQGDTGLKLKAEQLVKSALQGLYHRDMPALTGFQARTPDDIRGNEYFEMAKAGIDNILFVSGSIAQEAKVGIRFTGEAAAWNIPLAKEVFRTAFSAAGVVAENEFDEEFTYQVQAQFAHKFARPGTLPANSLEKLADLFAKREEWLLADEAYKEVEKRIASDSQTELQHRSELQRKRQKVGTMILKLGLDKAQKTQFSVGWEVTDTFPPDARNALLAASERSGLRSALKEVTNAAVQIKVLDTTQRGGFVTSDEAGEIRVHVPFNRGYYMSEIAADLRLRELSNRTLSLNPYAGVMVRMLEFKKTLLTLTSGDLKRQIESFALYLHLTKPGGSEVYFRVDGGKRSVKPPDRINVSTGGLDNTAVDTQDPEGTQQSGYFVLEPAKSYDGRPTSSYPVYEFFEMATE